MYGLNFAQFSRLHTFHLVIDANMFIVQAGTALRKVIPDITGKKFYNYFELRRPRLKPSFDDIRDARNAAFLIDCSAAPITLKGQMLLDEQRKLLFFIGTPIIRER